MRPLLQMLLLAIRLFADKQERTFMSRVLEVKVAALGVIFGCRLGLSNVLKDVTQRCA